MSEVAEENYHPRVQAVVDALASLGAGGTVRVLPDSARTAAEAAAALGAEVGAIVNSLVFDADGEAVLVLTSGAHRVDTDKLVAEQSLPALSRAKPDFVRKHTGQAIGGVSPVAHPAPVRTFVDNLLAEYDTVWAAAGHPHAVFSTTYDELLRITAGAPVDVA